MLTLEVDDNGQIEVVFNTCYGGFSLSEEAILRMIELGSEKAKTCYKQQKKHRHGSYYIENLRRYDPILVQTVKELENKASGDCASLAIGKVSLFIDIKDYDGKETVAYCYDSIRYGRYDGKDF